jgi:hypothetical protein
MDTRRADLCQLIGNCRGLRPNVSVNMRRGLFGRFRIRKLTKFGESGPVGLRWLFDVVVHQQTFMNTPFIATRKCALPPSCHCRRSPQRGHFHGHPSARLPLRSPS